jgi:hypothetical protein
MAGGPKRIVGRESGVPGVIVRKRPPTAGPSRFVVFPREERHGLVTEGARAYQVGVNPPWRAVAVVGVDAVTKAK